MVMDDNTGSYSSGLSCYTFNVGTNQALYKYQDTGDIDPTTEVTVTGTRSASKNQVQFTFCYELDPCPAVSDMSYELVGNGTSEAIVRWNISDADYLSGFDVILAEDEISDFSEKEPTYTIEDDSISLSGLEAAKHYYVYVRAICKAEGKDEGSSTWVGVDFTTNADCPEVQNLHTELAATNAVKASWDLAFAEQEEHFIYVLTDVELDQAQSVQIHSIDTTELVLTDLEYDKEYHLYVASVCGSAYSEYQHVSFTTLPSCQAVENLVATRVAHNLVELTWSSAQFASETEWKVGIVGGPEPQVVSERHAILFGLDAETEYQAYVMANCEDGESDAVKVAFTTAGKPGDCEQIGYGSYNGYYAPMASYYKNSWTQFIYPASEVGSARMIESIAFYCSEIDASKDLAGEVSIYMAHTSMSTHATTSAWVAADDLKLVYHTDAFAKPTERGWMSFELSEAFQYNGMDNIAIVVAAKLPNYSTSMKFDYTPTTDAVLYRGNDSDTGYGDHPGTLTGTRSTDRPNILFCSTPKDCPDVTALAISDITTNSAKASWEPMGSEIAWNVFIANVMVTDFSDLDAYNVERVESLSKTFEGLDDDTDYFVYVQPADCSGADFSRTNFRTIASCLKQTNPSAASETITAHTAIVSWIDPNAEKAGLYTIAYAKADEFDLDDPEILTESAVDTFALLQYLQADTVYKFAVKANCDDNDASRWSEVAQFATLPSCFTPTSPEVLAESITENSAVVYWKDEHNDAAYIVAYGPYDAFDIHNPETYEIKNVTDTFALLDGLNAATKYAFCVKGDCSSESEGLSKNWTYVVPFTTECVVFSLPFVENFNSLSSGIPVCWDNSEGTTTTSSYCWNYFANGYDGACVRFNSYNNPNNLTNELATPVIVLSEDAQLSFVCKNPTGGDFKVQIAEVGSAEREDLLTGLTGITAWTEQEVDLSAYTGKEVIIYFCGTSNYGSGDAYLYLDNVAVSRISSCKKPASIEVSDITSSSASFNWVAGGEESEFQYIVVAKDSTPDWSVAIDVVGTTALVEGLEANSQYDFYVRANCGEEKSDARSISFRTDCGAVTLPYQEFFEGDIYCWTMIDCDSNTGLYDGANYEGENGFRFFYNKFPPQYLISPEFIASEKKVEVSFYYRAGNANGTETFKVGYSSSTKETTAFNWSEEITAANTWELYKDTLEAGVKYIAIQYTADDQYYLYIDNFAVEEIGGTGTGMDAIESKQTAIKRIENDQVVIIRDGKKYTIMGVKIQ